jgi:CheY-like chemotaxis protein
MSFGKRSLPALILVVDDDEGDRLLIRETLEHSALSKQIQVVEDGEAALDYTYQRGRYAPPAAAPRPDLMLLDLNMPRVSGKEVLSRLKQDPEMRDIPILVFTTSQREEDVSFCYSAGANSYVQKPSDLDQLQNVLRAMETYWLEIAERARASPWVMCP